MYCMSFQQLYYFHTVNCIQTVIGTYYFGISLFEIRFIFLPFIDDHTDYYSQAKTYFNKKNLCGYVFTK